MIPISVTISAFGPYPNSVDIDFNSFRNEGIFLVSGKTGSGKTMIFDAIMFALYGQTSGSLRKTDQLRCDKSENDIATFVELKFELRNRIYTIRRNPKYTLEGKKTAKMHHAMITFDDGKIIEGVKEVDSCIVELLGVDAGQFKQIAMIAQGEFSKVIHASSGDREKILRTLFSTGHYLSMEYKLREIVKKYEDELLVYNGKRDVFTSNLSEDFNLLQQQELIQISSVELNKIKDTRDTLLQQVALVEQSNKDISLYNQLTEQLKEYLLKQDHFNNIENNIDILKKCKQLKPSFDLLKQTENKLVTQKQNETLKQNEYNTNKEKLDNILIEFKQLDNKYLEIKNTENSIEQLKDQQTKYVSYQNHVKQLHNLKEKHNKLETTKTLLLTELNESNKSLDKLSNDLLLIPNLENQLNDIFIEKDSLKNQLILLKDIEKITQNISVLNQIELSNRETYISDNTILEQLEKQSSHTRTEYMNNQAGIIASALNDNDACPVCGSTCHPSLAKISTQVSLQDVEILETNCNDARTNREKSHTKLLESQSNVQQQQILLEQKQSLIKEGLNITVVKDVLLQLDNQFNEINDQLKLLNNTNIQTLKDKVNETENRIKSLDIELLDINMEASNIEGQLVGYSGYESIDVEQLENTLTTSKIHLEQLENNVKNVESSYKTFNENSMVLSRELELLDDSISLTIKEINDQTIEFNSLLIEYQLDEQNYLININSIHDLEDLIEQLTNYHSTIKVIQSKLLILQDKVKDKQLVDIDEVKLQISTINIDINQKESELNVLKELVTNYINNKKELDLLEKEYQVVLDKLQVYMDLKDMMTGKNKHNISFERYVLASYFEQILEYANIYLHKMTQGRYKLQRRIEKSSGGGKQGLDLDVFDVENGSYREVTSLSGGESFKAALSLALGMSEMIQSSSGGISIQTVFIDEGFGTLDSESLDQAVECLMDVQGSDKLVGIISHVEELKTRITNQIVIDRVNNISNINIIHN